MTFPLAVWLILLTLTHRRSVCSDHTCTILANSWSASEECSLREMSCLGFGVPVFLFFYKILSEFCEWFCSNRPPQGAALKQVG